MYGATFQLWSHWNKSRVMSLTSIKLFFIHTCLAENLAHYVDVAIPNREKTAKLRQQEEPDYAIESYNHFGWKRPSACHMKGHFILFYIIQGLQRPFSWRTLSASKRQAAEKHCCICPCLYFFYLHLLFEKMERKFIDTSLILTFLKLKYCTEH